MACFTAPVAEAIATTIVKKEMNKKGEHADCMKNPFVKRLGWLNNMLWGGSALLAFEHVWHGEVTPWFPFLTNASTPESMSVMLKEIATSGIAMAVLVTAVWAGIVAFTNTLEKSPSNVNIAVSGGKR